MTVIDLTERRKRDAIDNYVAQQGDEVAKALMSMSRMSWAKGMTGDEALRRAAQAFQAAAGKMR